MTCDNATENASCAKKMGCTDDDPKFPNPSPEYEGEFIWWYFDPPHLLKLFRNHFLDQGKKKTKKILINLLDVLLSGFQIGLCKFQSCIITRKAKNM